MVGLLGVGVLGSRRRSSASAAPRGWRRRRRGCSPRSRPVPEHPGTGNPRRRRRRPTIDPSSNEPFQASRGRSSAAGSGIRRSTFRRNRQPLQPKEVDPRQHRGVVKEIESDGFHRSLFGSFEETPLRPFVERPHRRPAPDLVVDLPARLAGVRPAGRHAGYQRKTSAILCFGFCFARSSCRGSRGGRSERTRPRRRRATI